MKIIPLSTIERQQGGFTHKFIITEADLTVSATATAQVINLMALAVGMLVASVATRLITAFQDAGDAASILTPLTVGDTGSAARFLASQELNVNGTEIYHKAGTGTQLAYDTADTLQATFGPTTTGKTLLALTAGEVHIFARIVNLVELSPVAGG